MPQASARAVCTISSSSGRPAGPQARAPQARHVGHGRRVPPVAAEYVLAGGNENVVLCERGIRTFSSLRFAEYARRTVVPAVARLSTLSVHGRPRRTRAAPRESRRPCRARRSPPALMPSPSTSTTSRQGAIGRSQALHARHVQLTIEPDSSHRGGGPEGGMSGAVLVLGPAFPAAGSGRWARRSAKSIFNTGMCTGYQETLTDPSYRGQIVVMTAAHVGNYGLNDEDVESSRIQVAGFAARHFPDHFSSARGKEPIGQGLAEGGVVGIDELDARALVRHLRSRGVMRGEIATETACVRRGRHGARREVKEQPTMAGAALALTVRRDKAVRLSATPPKASRGRRRIRGSDRLRHLGEHPAQARRHAVSSPTVLPAMAVPEAPRRRIRRLLPFGRPRRP